ncbi:TspO/MBR family protein [Prosthecobacter sp.]|jgi:benzodiazapine receptor|uniref:TspO/MBR family protein n=1 Tax=Prosthecobacter sp. TaxID=1965333 RepID=UPI00378327AD
MSASTSSSRNALALGGFLVVTFCAPALSAFIGMPGPWYAALNKPTWNPPPWLFGPAWTLLYTLMAVAAWMVWKRAGFAKPLKLYFVQLALNAAWTPIFFGAHEMGWALVEILALWIAILMTLRAFWAVSRPAGMLLVPYLAWVSFASVLNFTLWRLNS